MRAYRGGWQGPSLFLKRSLGKPGLDRLKRIFAQKRQLSTHRAASSNSKYFVLSQWFSMILIQVVLEFVQGFDAKNSEACGCCIHCGLVSKARLDANNLPQRSHGKCTGTGKKANKNRKMKRSCPHQSGEGLYILRQLLLPSPLPPPSSTPPP